MDAPTVPCEASPAPAPAPASPRLVLPAERLDDLLAAIRARGYELIGPTVREGAIVYDRIDGVADLPRGVTDEQAPGRYRLARRDDGAYFGFAVGPQSWKRFLHPPLITLYRTTAGEQGIRVAAPADEVGPRAFLGVRACELHAIAIQDRVLLGGAYPDPHYARRRAASLIVAVNCGTAGGTCFCASMGAGPRCAAGYDLALTEVIDGGGHRFVLEAASDEGRALAAPLGLAPAGAEALAAASAVVERTERSMGRALDTAGLPKALQMAHEHPRWDEVAARCLACASCTMVCPTCFCTAVEDVQALAPEVAERSRRWDSCFTGAFSHIHGGSVRDSTRSRYRQWLTHKLGTWHDQFGTAGCVGCGRCITWCPVGIDITEEAAALRVPAAAAAVPTAPTTPPASATTTPPASAPR